MPEEAKPEHEKRKKRRRRSRGDGGGGGGNPGSGRGAGDADPPSEGGQVPGWEINLNELNRVPEELPEFTRSVDDVEHLDPADLKKVKVVKKNQGALPEWDRGGPSAEQIDAEKRKAEEDHEGLVKKQRPVRKKRRVPSWIEKVFVYSPKLFMALVAAVLVMVVASALIIANKVAFQKSDAAVERARMSALENPVILDPALAAVIPGILTQENALRASELLRDYFDAETPQDKLDFVRNPERIEQLMTRWYSRPDKAEDAKPCRITEVLRQKQVVIAGRVFVMTAVQLSPEQRIKFTAVEKVGDDEFKVDWEVTEGYQEMPLRDLQLAQPMDPKRFRVFVKESDYYNGHFADQVKYRCYRLTSPADAEFLLWGYTERGTALEEAIAKLVPPGAGASVILDVTYPENPASDNQVTITKLVHPNWFPDPDEVPLAEP